MIQEYFTVGLSDGIHIGLTLEDMATVAQFEPKDICLVPGVASFWYGVVNFKGALLWILDCDRFFNLNNNSNAQITKFTSVVLTHNMTGTTRKVALVVQQLEGILSVDSSKLQPLPNSLPSNLQSLCTAAVEQENKVTYILNSEAFLQQIYQQSLLVAA